jgi:hypothetical protein
VPSGKIGLPKNAKPHIEDTVNRSEQMDKLAGEEQSGFGSFKSFTGYLETTMSKNEQPFNPLQGTISTGNVPAGNYTGVFRAAEYLPEQEPD